MSLLVFRLIVASNGDAQRLAQVCLVVVVVVVGSIVCRQLVLGSLIGTRFHFQASLLGIIIIDGYSVSMVTTRYH